MLDLLAKTMLMLLLMLIKSLPGSATLLFAQDDAAPADAADSAGVDAAAAVEAAAAAALEWLELADAGEYRESWQQGAAALQEALTPEAWATALGDARGPLEPFGERTQISARYATELPNAPAGEYVILQYRTAVAGDRTVVETIVPMKEDGAWKVSGYFVRPE
jgi:hypothetical protein